MLSCPPVAPNPLLRPQSDLPASTALVPGCLTVLACCAVVGIAALQLLPAAPSGDPAPPRMFAAAIGLFGGLGLQSFYHLARGFGRGRNSLASILARAGRNTPPVNGEPIIATGTIRTERPLTSPIGGVPCVAYDYRMYTVRSVGGGKANQVPVYWGYAAQPFAIDAPSISYPVASVPLPPGKAAPLAGDDVLKRARSYVRSTGWETVEFGMLGTMDTVFQRVGDDARSGTRRDFALANEDAPDVAALTLEETVLPVGATASGFGRWSSRLGAINAPEWLANSSHVVVALGGPENLAGQPGLPQSTTSYVVTAFALTAIAAGIFVVARIAIPTMH
jgi:hypothetical protein